MYRRVLSPPTSLFLVVVLGVVFHGSEDPGDLRLSPARDVFTQGFRHGFFLRASAANGDGFFHQRGVEIEIRCHPHIVPHIIMCEVKSDGPTSYGVGTRAFNSSNQLRTI